MEISILGFKYVRLILEKINLSQIEELKRKYSYLYIVTYKKIPLSGFNILCRKTAVIDLSQGLEQIFQKFNKTTRNEIRKTERITNLHFVILDNNFNEAYNLYRKVKRKDGVVPEPKSDFKECKFFNAYLKDRMIVSIACYNQNKILRLKSIVSLRKMREFDKRIMGYATRRLIWEICKYGKANGYRKLDLGNVNLTDPTKAGIAKFKISFGGDLVDNYIYRYETKIFALLRKILRLTKIINIH